jgi:hypothetical protein
MINAVFSWRCKCGLRIKVVGEIDRDNPTAKSKVKCPRCNFEQIIAASRVLSVTRDQDEILQHKGMSA